jgi:ATP-dependent RNA helicase DDX56/DBP9
MDLDPRLLKAIAKLGWDNPTAIQEKAIPLALEGKDLIVRAKTGSGKTAGYSIPLIHKILKYKDNNKSTMKPFIHALVMIPTKELSQQATKHIKDLCSFCSRDVKVVGVSHVMSSSSQRVSIMECPDVVVGTPAMILTHLVENHLVIDENFQMIVFDEADLLFSFGYENDIKEITKYLPVAHQAILMSATLNEEILSLKKLVLHQPVRV